MLRVGIIMWGLIVVGWLVGWLVLFVECWGSEEMMTVLWAMMRRK
jgi:hypothetical protein